jgi:saccharopine dehydrogenase-like NADP-dependent oxidoreductase
MTSSSNETPSDTVELIGAGRVGRQFVNKLTRASYATAIFVVDAEVSGCGGCAEAVTGS